MSTDSTTLTKKDFQSDQEVRWCPGCGDYAILSAVQAVFPELGIPRERFVIISGIGCSSRFPYYMNTYGFHTIHGRAPAFATGLKMTRPDLEVWVVTGDGDSMSIGGNHFIHVLRRNVGIKVLMFNNRIYGLTKGQYSPTSEVGKRTPSTPFGVPDNPFNPLSVALGASARFVARAVDTDIGHLQEVIKRAAAYEGCAFVEIFQNCNVFNDLTFINVTAKDVKDERQMVLEHGKPLLFGKDRNKGIRLSKEGEPEVVEVGDGPGKVPVSELPVHDETRPNPGYAFMLAQLDYPSFPVPVGVLRALDSTTYDAVVHQQAEQARARAKATDVESLWNQGDVWDVGPASGSA
jgi:2-oxoglutarate ferredoxin oxidoreductase subunit beta